MNEIRTYLSESNDYQQGISLLERVDPRNRLLPQIRKGQSVYLKQKLRQELRRLQGRGATLAPVAEQAPDIEPESISQQPKVIHQTESYYPERVSAWIQERAKLVRQRDMKSNSLPQLPDQECRRVTREEIETLHAQVRELSDKIEHWKRTGEIAPDAPPELDDEQAAELRKQLNNAKANLSKKKSRIREWTKREDVNPAEKALKLKLYQRQARELEVKIEGLRAQL